MTAAFGLALLPPFQKLSLCALSLGDSILLDRFSEPPLLSLRKEKPREAGRGRPSGEVGVVGICAMLVALVHAEWI